MTKAFYEWDSDNACYIFWNDDIEKEEGVQVLEENFNGTVEKLQNQGLIVEEWEE